MYRRYSGWCARLRPSAPPSPQHRPRSSDFILLSRSYSAANLGRRAERLDQDQMQLGFEDLGGDIARVEATLPPAAGKAPGSPASQTERASMPAHLPREEM